MNKIVELKEIAKFFKGYRVIDFKITKIAKKLEKRPKIPMISDFKIREVESPHLNLSSNSK